MKTIFITFIAVLTFSLNTQAQETSFNTNSSTLCSYTSKADIHNVVGLYDWLANADKKNEWFVGENADLNTNGNCMLHTTYNFDFNSTTVNSSSNSKLTHTLQERLALTPRYQHTKVSTYNPNLGLDFRLNL